MSLSRRTMIALALFTGFFASGCPQRTFGPPANSFPQHHIGQPPGDWSPSPLGRSQPPPLVVPPKDLSSNPWKPSVAARKWKSIVIHHTATSRGSVASIHASHLRRKDAAGRPWRGIGYHFVIGNGNGMRDGEIASTFRWKTQLHGAHAGNRLHNQYGVGIALIGNFEKHRPTKAQLASIKRLVAVLKREYRIPAKSVVGHSRIRSTACPGKFFPLAEVSQSETDMHIGSRTTPGTPPN